MMSNLSTVVYVHGILSDSTTPYPIVTRRPNRLINVDTPCILPKALLSLVISFECGGLS